ncbi:MAG: helix-turn-helix transcriptional regulator [Arenicellales bacterium]|jgi:transcriptional regulator with XRE-family HTH domain
MDKRDRARLFRDRLGAAIRNADSSRSALARATGVDRSTLTQILNSEDPRLPNVHLAAECAEALGVSADWLLGLSDRHERAADILSASFQFKRAARTPADEFIQACHREAAGYKFRHVPASLPDGLKIETVLEHEYRAFLGKTPEQAIVSMRDSLNHIRAPGSDVELCTRIDVVETFARGEGYWKGLPADARRAQLDHMARMCREYYPSLRLYLFDPKKIYSSPLGIYGPLLAIVYVGQFYMVFRDRLQVIALTGHFDQLVREAEVDARSAADWIEQLGTAVESGA